MSIGRIAGKGAAEQLIGVEEMLRKQAERQLEQPQNGAGNEATPQRSVTEAVRAAKTNAAGGLAEHADSGSSRSVEASLKSNKSINIKV